MARGAICRDIIQFRKRNSLNPEQSQNNPHFPLSLASGSPGDISPSQGTTNLSLVQANAIIEMSAQNEEGKAIFSAVASVYEVIEATTVHTNF